MNRTAFYTALAHAQAEFQRLYTRSSSIETTITAALAQVQLPHLPEIRCLINHTPTLAASDFSRNYLELEQLKEAAWWAYIRDFIKRARASFVDFGADGMLPAPKWAGFTERHNLSKAEATWLSKLNCFWLERNIFEPLEVQARFLID